MTTPDPRSEEHQRVQAMQAGQSEWRRWGTYVSERQWGSVREDYSADGDAWNYFTHDQARSRAYRWGEDGIAGFCDDRQLLCLSLALWNGRDPILKERLFGLTNQQGNHGEDVKELYYYVDAVPSHAYCKMLYKMCQGEYPYQQLLDENARRDRSKPEFELLDTGLFNDDRYFDVEVEYAKASADDILMLVTAHNRGPDPATIHLLPQVWFRNVWSWSDDYARPHMFEERPGLIHGDHAVLGRFNVAFDTPDRLAFCENGTNATKVFGAQQSPGYFKDGIDEFVVGGREAAINPAMRGTKAAGIHRRVVPSLGSVTVRVRLRVGAEPNPGFADFDAVMARRRQEADAFYAMVQSGVQDADMRLVQRQAFAGLLWSKQFYYFDVAEWLDGDPRQPQPPPERRTSRDAGWRHLSAADIISMPDKWEYPWFAAWDLAFHCVSLSLIDPGFAKNQLLLLSQVWMMHPNGQLPAYEWSFDDVNPPVHAWAALRVFEHDRRWNGGVGDVAFLERIFHKLLLNFTWWVNRKDSQDLNIFEGGFLGLDNIGLFDRSAPLPGGGHIQQSDGTAWMAAYCLNMLHIALELGQHDRVYEDMATKFFEHLLYIARAMIGVGGTGGLWDDTDYFYYDRLSMPDGSVIPMRIRSIVGLIPLIAVTVMDADVLRNLPGFHDRMEYFHQERSDLATLISRWADPGTQGRHLLSLARRFRMTKLLTRMLDEQEFLSPHGVRALSRTYAEHPYVFRHDGAEYRMEYQPAESRSGLFGGNSNWRGPVWMPVNYLFIESLRRFHSYYGDDYRIECPTGSGQEMTLEQVADHLSARLIGLFLRDASGRRPIFGKQGKLQADPHFKDLILFNEYFDGDNGSGLGASHQTGWTALVANLIDSLGVNPKAAAADDQVVGSET